MRRIIEEIGKICERKSWEDFYGFFKRVERRNKCDYKCGIMLVRSYCDCAKIKLKEYVNVKDLKFRNAC